MGTLAQELFNTLSANRSPGPTDFRASKMFSLVQDPFGLWCDYHAPLELAFEENVRYDNARSAKDKSSKADIILSRYPDAVIISGESQEETFLKTLEAMEEGRPYIGYPSLWDLRAHVLGRATLLIRENSGKSVFGDYHYRVVQMKRAGELKDHYTLQAALINRILSDIQQYAEPHFTVTLRHKEMTISQHLWTERLDRELALFKTIQDGTFQPETGRPPKAAQSPWRKYANDFAAKAHSLVMIPAIGYPVRETLRANGYNTTDDIADADPLAFGILMEDQPGKDIYMSAMSYRLGKPVLKQAGIYPPERKKRALYFDF
ncbi:MAG: hypothetical protein WCS77_09590, partial [Elusimicrobiaceae bacterium]